MNINQQLRIAKVAYPDAVIKTHPEYGEMFVIDGIGLPTCGSEYADLLHNAETRERLCRALKISVYWDYYRDGCWSVWTRGIARDFLKTDEEINAAIIEVAEEIISND